MVLVVLLLLLLPPSQPASAFPVDDVATDCSPANSTHTVIEYMFDPVLVAALDPAELSVVRNGLQRWNYVNDLGGGILVRFVEVSGTWPPADTVVTIHAANLTTLASARCRPNPNSTDDRRIRFDLGEIRDTNAPSSPVVLDRFEKVATHEAGHIIGLSHSDPTCCNSANIPIMSTCNSPEDRHHLAFDDRAALNHDDHAVPYAGTIGSNPGWEEGWKWHYTYSNLDETIIAGSPGNSGSKHGSYYVGTSRTDDSITAPASFVRQTINFYDGQPAGNPAGMGSPSPGAGDRSEVDNRVYMRSSFPTSGFPIVNLQLWVRPVWYADANPSGCHVEDTFPYPGSPTLGRVETGSSQYKFVLRSEKLWGASTNWVYLENANYDLADDHITADAFSVRSLVMNLAGSQNTVYFDTLGARDAG